MAEEKKVENTFLLLVAMVSFTAFALAEIVAAFVSHSESLLGDAATMVIDGITYAINLWAETAKKGKSDVQKLKIDTIAPAVSTVALIGVTIYVMRDAIERLKNENGDDQDVNVTVMWIFAAVNLVLDFGNIIMFFMKKVDGRWKLDCSSCRTCGKDEDAPDNLNMLSALAHVAADTLRSVAVLFAGLFAQISPADDDNQADAIGAVIVSVAIVGSIFPLTYAVFKNVLQIMEGVPYHDDRDPTVTQQLLDDVFHSDDDEEEIVPFQRVSR
eukprot:m.41166 g.41166  ORF g.41166 m.41166 type:complete len:271 (+) comp9740_c0_seq2:135-947(+)